MKVIKVLNIIIKVGISMELAKISEKVGIIRTNIEKVIVGKSELN